ncbi:MAG: winged helix-turn-helix domain-containing protein [Planctomycetota bacterium]|jgi:DNA-binding MarR family transcriptional regulator
MATLNTIIHQPVRLKIMSSLMSIDTENKVDFTYLRNVLELTDGNLGAHLNKLEEAGYIKIEKTFVGKKPKTYICLTGKGRDAFNEHIMALDNIVKGINN